MRYGKYPDYSRLQPFGQQCTVMYPKRKAPNGKLGKQAMKGFLVGYDDVDGTKAYRVLVGRKIIISPDVTFLDRIDKGTLMPDVSRLEDAGKHQQTQDAEDQHKQQQDADEDELNRRDE